MFLFFPLNPAGPAHVSGHHASLLVHFAFFSSPSALSPRFSTMACLRGPPPGGRGTFLRRPFPLVLQKTRNSARPISPARGDSSPREKIASFLRAAMAPASPTDSSAQSAAESRVYVHLVGVAGSSGSGGQGNRKVEKKAVTVRLSSVAPVHGSFSVCQAFLRRLSPRVLSASRSSAAVSTLSSACRRPRSCLLSVAAPLVRGESCSSSTSLPSFSPSPYVQIVSDSAVPPSSSTLFSFSLSRSFVSSPFSSATPSSFSSALPSSALTSLLPSPLSPSSSAHSFTWSSAHSSSPQTASFFSFSRPDSATSSFRSLYVHTRAYSFTRAARQREDEARRHEAARKAFFESMNQTKKEEQEREAERRRQRAEVQKQGPFLHGQDYYQILSVKRSASQEEIKKAYLEAAKRHHPDQNPEDPADAAKRFQAVQQAYATLKKPWCRTLYDQELDGSFRSAQRTEAGREPGPGTRAAEKIWKETWEETAEQREQRRERYRRYAAGIREDLPYVDTINPVWIIAGTSAAVFGFAAYINDKGKKSFDAALNDDFTDEDFRGDKLVRAFFNPFSAKWERLPDGYDPPAPRTLHSFYRKQYPNIQFDAASLPANQLTLIKVPRSQTEPARLLVNRRTGETLWAHQIRPQVNKSSSEQSSTSDS
ncbi:DnaJ domain-containing protein [Toxoplasma gondii p89]|uniref:DnaJ domain-containing protein n=1 Tax=Toxoplasma gondii p89 TaxID=943119 RepID=A0A086L1E6_TOXGO|nr:DnaJ domain-containing protein [Toxoplasma gondii p89]